VSYHIKIIAVSSEEPLVILDKEAGWVEEHIAAPRREGRAIFMVGRVYSWDAIYEIHIYHSDQTSEEVLAEYRRRMTANTGPGHQSLTWVYKMSAADIVADERNEVTERFITGPPGMQMTKKGAGQGPAFATNRKAVMVIYGHDHEANNALFAWLRAVGLQPKEWSQLVQLSGSASPYIGQVLDHAFQDAQAVVALFTPDERVRERGSLQPAASSAWRLQARPNVLIEAGMALASHPDRTVLITLGHPELPSDLAGRHYIRLDGSPGPLNDIANRLDDAGCEVDRTGTDWLDATRFPDRNHIAADPPNSSAP
jgi:predicted nucleotide-binding protein